jgi:hypothetical protein
MSFKQSPTIKRVNEKKMLPEALGITRMAPMVFIDTPQVTYLYSI